MKDSSFAVYDNAQATKRYEPYLSCDIVDTGIQNFPVTFAYAMPKNSPFFALFQYHIGQLKEIGVFKRYQDEHGGEYRTCPYNSEMPMSQNRCFTAFIILLDGAGMSLLWLA